MHLLKSSRENLKELPLVKKLADVLEENDIFVFAVPDENEEELYEQYEKEHNRDNTNSTIKVPKFRVIPDEHQNEEEYIRPDHYIVYSGKKSSSNDEEIHLEREFL